MDGSRFERVFESQTDEHAFRVERVEGTIPPELSGTLLRAGPGVLRVGADPLDLFDGHAMVAGVSFDRGEAVFRSRHVRTPLYEAETAARAMKQRRLFTNLPSRWANLFALDLGASAMHDTFVWGDGDARRVVASNDPAHFGLDPRTLATTGPLGWDGVPAKGHDRGPMPYRDPSTGRLIGWVKKVGGLRPDALQFVELDGAFRVVKQTPFHALGTSPAIVHDQRASGRWYVAVEQAARLSPLQAMWGARTVFQAIATPPGATATLLLVPRDGDGPLIRVPLPAPHETSFHVINAYDEGDQLIVDLPTYDGRVNFDAAAPRDLRERVGAPTTDGAVPRPHRFVVDPAAGKVVSCTPLGSMPCEAPEVADDRMGLPYRFAWFPTEAPGRPVPDRGAFFYFGALGKLDVTTGEEKLWVADDALVTPCAFVPRPGATAEDDGWLLAYLMREAGAALVILDAAAHAPVATLDLGVHLPGASHVRWADIHLDA